MYRPCDELEKIYLWGVKVYGERPSAHLVPQAGFGVEGDREGWDSFLRLASRLFAEYGDIPFVHWGSYERAKLRLYLDRYGDRDGTAARLLDQLVDLLDVVRESVVFPLPSLSLSGVSRSRLAIATSRCRWRFRARFLRQDGRRLHHSLPESADAVVPTASQPKGGSI
jgi:hypothetical protein